jgi:hypothetical protein
MKTIALASALAMLFAMCLQATSAQAMPRTWVANGATGNGSGDPFCSRHNPCSDFNTALNVTDDGGEIDCVNSGDYSFSLGVTINITKSVTIDCAALAGTEQNSVPAIVISGPSIIVKLRNLTVGGTFGAGLGIGILNAHSVYVENCRISNFNGSPGIGIAVATELTFGQATSRLFVKDSVITSNGLPASGGGIVVQPVAGQSARVVIENSHVNGNTYGIFANGTGSGSIMMTITDSVVANNAVDGISSYAPGGTTVTTIVNRTSSVQNGNVGIVAIGPNASVIVSQSLVASNVYGFGASQGGNISSFGNNRLIGNVNDLTPNGTVALK